MRGAKYLSIAISASEHMNQLLDDLVEFSRASQSAEQVSRFDANLVVDKVVDGLSVAIQNSRAEITHGDLPFVTANTMRFERLMHNLIGNALKYVGRRHAAARAHSRRRARARSGAFPSPTTASASTRVSSNAYSSRSSDCIRADAMRAPGWG